MIVLVVEERQDDDRAGVDDDLADVPRLPVSSSSRWCSSSRTFLPL